MPPNADELAGGRSLVIICGGAGGMLGGLGTVKILHVLDHSLPLQSGYTFRTLGILTAQRKRGWQTVQMTTPKQYEFGGAVDAVDGWTFYRTPQPSPASQKLPLLRELWQMRATRQRLDEVIDETRPDTIGRAHV